MTAQLSSSHAARSDAERMLDRIVGIGVLVGALATLVAGATVWLLLTDPVALTGAVGSEEAPELALTLARVIIDLLIGLIAYL